MKKIGLVIAMSREMEVFLEKIGEMEESCLFYNDLVVRKYHAGGNELYLLDSGVGEVSSALATFLLVHVYGVDEIVNFGVCGSLDNSLGVADIVLVESVLHFDRDTSPIDNCDVGYYPEFGEKYLTVDGKTLEKAKKVSGLRSVVCASSEKFVANSELKERLKRDGANICEMESAGVVITCKRLGVPCLIVKAVSDKADEDAGMSFQEMMHTAMQKCSDFLVKYLSE